MKIFDEICNTVNKSVRPEVTDLIPNDFDEDDEYDDAMEALGKKGVRKDPEDLTDGLTKSEIAMLEKVGESLEDEDDDFDEESVDSLLKDYPESVYAEEVEDALSSQDEEDIDEDFDDDDL